MKKKISLALGRRLISSKYLQNICVIISFLHFKNLSEICTFLDIHTFKKIGYEIFFLHSYIHVGSKVFHKVEKVV